MDEKTRNSLVYALGHIRSAMVCDKFQTPIMPALECAEKELMRLLFTVDEINEYLIANGRKAIAE